MTSRQAKLAETKARKIRAASVSAACEDEIGRLNDAIQSGTVVRMPVSTQSLVSGYFVRSVNPNFVATVGRGEHADWITDSVCYLCNDGRWAHLMAAAGLARNPLFA